VKDELTIVTPNMLPHRGDIRVKFKAMLEGKKVCFPGNQWLEGKLLLTGAYYFYIV